MKQHLTDQQIIDFVFDLAEPDAAAFAKKHTAKCKSCGRRAGKLRATVGQLDLVRGETAAPETLILDTLRRVRVETTPAQHENAHWWRIIWIGATAAAAILVAVVLLPQFGKHPAAATVATWDSDGARQETAASDKRADAAPREEQAKRLEVASLAGSRRAREPEARMLAKAEKKSAPAATPAPTTPPPAPAVVAKAVAPARAAISEQLAFGGQAMPAVEAPAPAKPALPMTLAAPVVQEPPAAADADASRLSERIRITLPSTSGSWQAGPQSMVRIRATAESNAVSFRLANQSRVMTADIRICPPRGSNILHALSLPAGATTSIVVRRPAR